MARKTQAQRAAEELDKQIERLYYQHADRRQIDIMKIGKLFADARTAHVAGTPLEDAVKAAIEKFCDPVSPARP